MCFTIPAGSVPRMLKKKLKRSTYPLKEDIQLCLLDLLDDGDEEGGMDTVDQPWRSHLSE